MLPVLLLFVLGCEPEPEVEYGQFNSEADTLSIEVGAAEALDTVSVILTSSTGEVEVGEAEVTPGGGPVGTIHTIIVRVDDSYEDIVDRVSVRTTSPDRGEDEYDLVNDSADEGLYKLELQSVGEDGEQRTDTLTIRLWDEVGDVDGQDTDSER